MRKLIKGALIHTPENIYGGIRTDILIENGKIKEITQDIQADDAEIIEAGGKHVYPGLIDAHTHIGIYEEIIGERGDDVNEISDPITPHMQGLDGVNPLEMCWDDARKAGITTVATGPGSANVIGGTFVALKSKKAKWVDKMVLKNPVAMKAALGENPKTVYAPRKQAPFTRMAEAALMRDALIKTREYLKKKLQAEEDDKKPEYNPKWEALIPVIQGKIPLKVHAHRADDIATAIRIAREFNIKLTLDHVMDAHIVIDLLEEAFREGMLIGVILGPYMTDRFKPEVANASFDTPAKVSKRGILFSLMTDHPVVPIQYLPLMAIYSTKHGLDKIEAVKAITINPAKILGIDDRVGSIEVGKDADLIITDGDILDPYTKVIKTIIDGEIVYP